MRWTCAVGGQPSGRDAGRGRDRRRHAAAGLRHVRPRGHHALVQREFLRATRNIARKGKGKGWRREGDEHGELEMAINLKAPDFTEVKPRILVFGVGGAGGNAINNMVASK